jgi:hypothetical protein
MPSPFPGMNPYLEQADCWAEFHGKFMYAVQDALNPLVNPRYLVRVETRLILHELTAEERRFFGVADVGFVTDRPRVPAAALADTGHAPVRLSFPAVEVIKQRSVEIRDPKNRRVVTVIEVLSPANKNPGPDRDDYLAKRRQIIATGTNLVEIDLRRGGRRPSPPDLPASDYYVLVSRAAERPEFGFWPVGLRDTLPVVPVPLADGDPDVKLDLMAILHEVYDRGAYGNYIYAGEPEPTLKGEDAAWAKALVSNGR